MIEFKKEKYYQKYLVWVLMGVTCKYEMVLYSFLYLMIEHQHTQKYDMSYFEHKRTFL